MPASKPTRPRAGLGLSSAIGRDQMTTRAPAKPKPAKPAPVASRKPERPRDRDKRATR